LVELLKAKLLKAESAGKDAKEGDFKQLKQALLVVSPADKQMKEVKPEDMKDFYEHLAGSLAAAGRTKSSPKLSALAVATQPPSSAGVALGTSENKSGPNPAQAQAQAQTEKPAAAGGELGDDLDFEEEGGAVKKQAAAQQTPPAPTQQQQQGGPKSVTTEDPSAVIVTAAADPDDEEGGSKEQQVCVVDLKNAEWWTLVEKEPEGNEELYVDVKPDGTSVDVDPEAEPDDFDDGNEEPLGEAFEIIKDDELASALAEYVALSMKHYPEAKEVPAEEMRRILDKAFGELKPKGVVSRVWGWGQFAYSAYGWGQWCFRMYKEPAVVKLVATGLWNTAQWALIFVL